MMRHTAPSIPYGRRILHAAMRLPLFLLLFLIYNIGSVRAQELDAEISINVQQIEASFRDRFTTLQGELKELINTQQWTGAQFAPQERIQCTFAFTIVEMPGDDTYKATLTVQARRPVYYSSYSTTTLNWQDKELTFRYTEGQMLNYNEFNLDNELVAVTAYYVYLILGLDFDSFAPGGGEAYLRRCENIVTQMQSADAPGWKAFDSKRNRHGLVTALFDANQAAWRQMWYQYHRQGLDAMYQSMDKGRRQITAGLDVLKTVRQADPQTPLLSLFIDAKIDELLNIYSEAPMTEKQAVYTTLQDNYPTYTNRLAKIKEEYRE